MKFHGVALIAIGFCGVAWAADSQTPARKLTPIAAGEKADGIKATAFAPLAYFNANCARCHGENGSFYEKDFAHNRDDAGLREVIDEMADGPAQAPLSSAELEAVSAWHRALRDKKPFVVIVKAEKIAEGWQLKGEVSSDATLQINGENVEVKDSQWTANVINGEVKLRATRGDAVTELDANNAAFAP